MDGKELWKLLDFVKGLQDKAEKIEKESEGAFDMEHKIKLKQKAAIHREIEGELRATLQNLVLGS